MSPVVTAFWVSFVVTLLAIAAALTSGWLRRRRWHLVLAPVAIAVLAVTIVLAEQMARARSFPPGPMHIHLAFAKTAALLVLPVIVTGLVLWRRDRWRRGHRLAVYLFLAVTITATCTGIWVFSLSMPR